MKLKSQIKLAGFILAALLQIGSAKAQLYFGLNSGYHFPVLRDYLGYQLISTPLASSEYQAVYSSYGAGALLSANAGYSFNSEIAVELEASFLYGNKIIMDASPYTFIHQEAFRPTILRLSPAVKLSTGKKKLRPYILVGPSVGIWPRMRCNYFDPDDNSNYIITIYKGGIPLGCRTELGVNWIRNKHWTFNGYLSGIFQNWSPKKSVITEWKINGQSVLESKTVMETETEYTEKPKFSGNVNAPRQSYKFTYPLSSAGIMIGVKYSF